MAGGSLDGIAPTYPAHLAPVVRAVRRAHGLRVTVTGCADGNSGYWDIRRVRRKWQ